MATEKAEIAKVVKKFQHHATDSGSSEVQVALMTNRLEYLHGHFTNHKKDYSSLRGLMKLVGKRKRLLAYLARTNPTSYKKLIEELKIRN